MLCRWEVDSIAWTSALGGAPTGFVVGVIMYGGVFRYNWEMGGMSRLPAEQDLIQNWIQDCSRNLS